jgi:hypothetical protein
MTAILLLPAKTATMTDSHNLNIDPDEIAKFEELASRWWDRNSEFKPLHDINPLRVGYIDRIASLAGKRILDVGCGGGILSESMAQGIKRGKRRKPNSIVTKTANTERSMGPKMLMSFCVRLFFLLI